MDTELAVCLNRVHKAYGRGTSKQQVLTGIDIRVPRASIYGLLGPSGCGKTTALRCAIGRLLPDSGEILTLGKPPNSIAHGVPGVRVGYMPQELALYQSMTMAETLYYFGRMHKMSEKRIAERIEFLLKFLNLPEQSRLISQLSGGQQRRTSFAVSLLHEPDLLILDEPTVGVDPLLRQRIWEHLVQLARESYITIVITTHYIEEARQANKVGLMRGGRLLAEASPESLLVTYNKQQLEEVFLELCELDQGGDIELNDSAPAVTSSNAVNSTPRSTHTRQNTHAANDDFADSLGGDLLSQVGSNDTDNLLPKAYVKEKIPLRTRLKDLVPSGWNIVGLTVKQLNLMKRQLGFLLFTFIMPAIQMTLFCLCVGRTPFDLTMAVVNIETDGVCHSACNKTHFEASCCFLSYLDTHTITQVNYKSDLEAGIESVKNGKSWGTIEIEKNFTQALLERMTSPTPLDNATLSASEVHLHLDMTNQQVAYVLQSEILQAMQEFIQTTLEMFGQDPTKAQVPIAYEEPIYGEEEPSFTNFMAPGIIISITFFMATGLTALVFVQEGKQGLLERSFVSGCTPVEIMIAHMITQCIIMAAQVALLLVVALFVFKVTCEGPLLLVITLTLLQGLTGMALGLVISAVCTEEVSAIQAALGSVYPNMLLSGIIWPLEGMPHWLRIFSGFLPMTYAAQAMRCILARGWSLEYMEVWRGVLVSIAWGWSLMVISAIIFKLKQ